MTAYYNEYDPFAAAWLRELIVDGLIAPGVVDERSIEDVTPNDLRDFTQCHFFAGIGVWSLAARQAGWADDWPLWTGSCPCQPFSAAGKGTGFDDERHLWPAFHYLIDQCRPVTIVGEQVASQDGLQWLDLVSADVEGSGYAFGAVDTCAAGFGAPHIRQRLYWLADTIDDGHRQHRYGLDRTARASENGAGQRQWLRADIADDVTASSLADAIGQGPQGRADLAVPGARGRVEGDGAGRGGARLAAPVGLEQPSCVGRKWRETTAQRYDDDGKASHGPQSQHGLSKPVSHRFPERPGPTNGLWRDADWLSCTDGKWRPVEPGTFPLADAGTVRNRVGTLRGAGNAVTLAQAAGFLKAVVEVAS